MFFFNQFRSSLSLFTVYTVHDNMLLLPHEHEYMIITLLLYTIGIHTSITVQ